MANRYLPVKNTNPMTNYRKPNQIINRNNGVTIFRGNIVDNMKFGSPGDQLSGYVRREVVLIDKNGNKQIAKEEQFFNSGKGIRVRINNR